MINLICKTMKKIDLLTININLNTITSQNLIFYMYKISTHRTCTIKLLHYLKSSHYI